MTQGEDGGVVENKQTEKEMEKHKVAFLRLHNWSEILDLNKLKRYLKRAHYQKSPCITDPAHTYIEKLQMGNSE